MVSTRLFEDRFSRCCHENKYLYTAAGKPVQACHTSRSLILAALLLFYVLRVILMFSLYFLCDSMFDGL